MSSAHNAAVNAAHVTRIGERDVAERELKKLVIGKRFDLLQEEVKQRLITERQVVPDPSGEGVWLRSGNSIIHSKTEESTGPDGEGPSVRVIEILTAGLFTASRDTGAPPVLQQYRAGYGLGRR
jgi:hypothetical protein